jgi:deoxycytidylate deaminase
VKLDKPSAKTRCACGDMMRDWFKPNRGMELCTAIHAEERAIKSLAGRSAEGGTLYTTTFPCFQCARQVLDARIKRVVYVEPYPVREAREFLTTAGCTIEPFTGFTCRAFFRVFDRTA